MASPNLFSCDICQQSFATRSGLTWHVKSCNFQLKAGNYVCPYCSTTFKCHLSVYTKHLADVHPTLYATNHNIELDSIHFESSSVNDQFSVASQMTKNNYHSQSYVSKKSRKNNNHLITLKKQSEIGSDSDTEKLENQIAKQL
jgi:hypothetical protein